MQLTTDEPPVYNVGDSVKYRGIEDNIWKILHIEQGSACWWVRASQNSTNQSFPAGVFEPIVKIERPKAKPIETVRAKPVEMSKPKPFDHIGHLLAETRDMEECYQIARIAGIDLERINHLSPALQKMNIGNKLRKMMKDGIFDPASIVWKDGRFVKN
jgi:hypothetical protein